MCWWCAFLVFLLTKIDIGSVFWINTIWNVSILSFHVMLIKMLDTTKKQHEFHSILTMAAIYACITSEMLPLIRHAYGWCNKNDLQKLIFNQFVPHDCEEWRSNGCYYYYHYDYYYDLACFFLIYTEFFFLIIIIIWCVANERLPTRNRTKPGYCTFFS